MSEPITVAAVDLGSNSVHMVIGRFLDEELHILDRMREPVCLAAGLDEQNRLSEEAQVRALACLERIGQRLCNVAPSHVRAVGTNTLRRARNAREFRSRAQGALGHPIEVISGQEEARLIYLGVSHSHEASDSRRLVVDIGGGSTEVILGDGFDVVRWHSLYMGCVDYTRQYFPGGQIRREGFRRAELQAQLELEGVGSRLRRTGWVSTVGSSGTIHAVLDAVRAGGTGEQAITLPAMKKLRKAMIAAGHVDRLADEGLKSDRARVFPGGVAILIGVFKSLGLESMSASPRSLREGVLYDLVGRIRHEDVRDRTISSLVRRYHVDEEQAQRVEQTALDLADQLGPAWIGEPESARQQLGWAARLHEIGLAVSFTGYHKHGQYLLTHADMPGFSADDKLVLATLVRGHRRKLSRALFEGLPPGRQAVAERWCVILRLAVALNRSRETKVSPRAIARDGGSTLELGFPAGWLEAHPLTRADLEQEALLLEPMRLRLELSRAHDVVQPSASD